jgi:trans-aconitate 2-methyltransferase
LWDPQQYSQFRDERAQPFYDLAALVQRRPGMRVVDLGCGGGELTRWLHFELEAAETLGVDRSQEMLAAAAQHAGGAVRFERRDIVDFAANGEPGAFDLVFSNAALQWVTGHATLLPQLCKLLAPGGQLAIQVPLGGDHPARPVLAEVAASEPYASALRGFARAPGAMPPDWYATRLHELGAAEQIVRMNVYGHVLERPRLLVEWFKGSALTSYRERLSSALYDSFVAEYTRRIVEGFGDDAPYFLPFNRVLLWARWP